MKWAKKIMGCVSEYIDQRGKNMGYSFGEWGEDPRAQLANNAVQGQWGTSQLQMAQQQAQMAQLQNQYAAQQTQPVNYRQTLGSTPKGQSPTFEQLEDPDSPFNLSLEALCNMWGARFGYRWVKDEDTADALEENSDMWSLVAQRLLDAGLLIHQQYRHLDMLGMGVAWKLIEKDHGNR